MDIHLRVYTVMDKVYWAASGNLDQLHDYESLTGGSFSAHRELDPVDAISRAAAEFVRILRSKP